MKTSVIGLVSVCVGALALAACASGANTATTSKKPNVVVRAANAQEAATIPSGYTLIKRDGVDFYCHSEAATGSRTQKKEVCQTKEQMEAQRNSSTKTLDYANGR